MSRTSNKWMRWGAGVALLIANLGLWLSDARPPFGVLLVVAALLIAFSEVRVRVEDDAVVADFALGFPRWRIRRSELADARVIDVRPLRYGGWGLRLVRRGWALVVRAGAAVELEMTNGRRLIVTVDDPQAVIAALG